MCKDINIATCGNGKGSLASLITTMTPILESSPYNSMSDNKYHSEEHPRSKDLSNKLMLAAEEKRKRKAAKRLALSGIKFDYCSNCNEIMTEVLWVDIIKINDKYYAESVVCPVEHKNLINIDPFFEYCRKKYNVDNITLLSLMMDYNEFPVDMSDILKDLPYGIENCGCHCLKCDAIQ